MLHFEMWLSMTVKCCVTFSNLSTRFYHALTVERVEEEQKHYLRSQILGWNIILLRMRCTLLFLTIIPVIQRQYIEVGLF